MHTPAHDGALFSKIKQFPKEPTPKDLKKEWYIYFYFLHNGTWEPVKKKGVNHIKTFKERVKELHALKKAMEIALDRGWNPVTASYMSKDETAQKVLNEKMNIVQAIDFAFDKCDVSANTVKNYRCCIKQVKKAIYALQVENLPISKVEKQDIKVIIEKASSLAKWSAKSFNKNLGYLQAVLTQLLEWEIIKYNPAHRIKKRKVFDSARKFIPYTKEEKRKIHDHFYMNHYGGFVYLMHLYHTGMRPMEALALKIKDIDFRNTVITIVPDPTRHNSKTKNVREVQINVHLLPLLREWVKDIANKECYVFGSPYEPGRGNKGSSKGRGADGALHPDYFKPSMTRIKRDTVTKLWKKIVIDHLGINKYQYAAKHTSTDDRLLAGVSIKAIQEMYGHTDEFMTGRYQTVLKRLYRAEINEKSPAFLE